MLARVVNLAIGPSSPLYAVLCAAAPQPERGCAFPPEVVLPAKLPCYATECNVTAGVDVLSLLNGTSGAVLFIYNIKNMI